MNNSIRRLTSSAGRRQFSLENANSVNTSMPSSRTGLDRDAHGPESGLVAGVAHLATRAVPNARCHP